MRRLMVSALLAATLFGAAGCQEDSGGDVVDTTTPQPAGEGEVLIKGTSFNPREVRTPVGKAVTWTFDDGGLEHTVTADDNSFDSGRMGSGTYAQTFNNPGNINYHCTVHARMRGTVIVG